MKYIKNNHNYQYLIITIITLKPQINIFFFFKDEVGTWSKKKNQSFYLCKWVQICFEHLMSFVNWARLAINVGSS